MMRRLMNFLSRGLLVMILGAAISCHAAQSITNVNTSSGTNTGTGDTLKVAFGKVNTNVAFLDSRLAIQETRVPATNGFYLTSFTVTNANDSTWGYGAGLMTWDAGYVYVSTGTNTWKRVALSTW